MIEAIDNPSNKLLTTEAEIEHRPSLIQVVRPLVEKATSDIKLHQLFANTIKAGIVGTTTAIFTNRVLSAFGIPEETNAIITATAGVIPPIIIHAKWYLSQYKIPN